MEYRSLYQMFLQDLIQQISVSDSQIFKFHYLSLSLLCVNVFFILTNLEHEHIFVVKAGA